MRACNEIWILRVAGEGSVGCEVGGEELGAGP